MSSTSNPKTSTSTSSATPSTSRSNISHLLPTDSTLTTYISQWFQEDTPSFDYGGFVVGEEPQEAILFCKSFGEKSRDNAIRGCILAGVPFFNAVFESVGCEVEWFFEEGARLLPPTGGNSKRLAVAKVKGPANKLLLGERPALNMIARASGIATRANRLVELARNAGWNGIIAATRKTTPGFRIVEKYATLVGGADTHRMDLSSMIMLKDNHIWSSGSITDAVKQAKSVGGFSLKIEVECSSERDADEAIQAGADIIMLDNFSHEEIVKVASSLKRKWIHDRVSQGKRAYSFLIEGSGGLTPDNILEYFKATDVDIYSFGSITQSVPHIDFSLKVQPKK